MSTQALTTPNEVAFQSIVNRAMEDPSYRHLLRSSPTKAIENYDMTDDLRQALISRNFTQLRAAAPSSLTQDGSAKELVVIILIAGGNQDSEDIMQ